MTGDDLERARRAWDALNRGDFDAVLEYVHPDIEWRPALGPGGAEGRVYRGRDAYERWLRTELLEVWEEFRAENMEFRELPGNRILLLGELVVRGKASGLEMRTPFGQIAYLRDGMAVRLDAFADHATALEAAAEMPD
jgi:ketosteroid isomerase-like protein